ncbi:MAG: Fe-S protein assembly co-chaperone HscB [Gemmataceae bacterium]
MPEPTHFERLGISRRFSLDVAALDRNYLDYSRRVHPDRAGDSAESLDASAALNEAYSVLRDPFRRADYLIALGGGPSAADLRQATPAFLEEMLELRAEVEMAKADAAARAELEHSLLARRVALVGEAGRHLDRYDELQTDDARRRELMTQARQALNACKYVQGLLRELQHDD